MVARVDDHRVGGSEDRAQHAEVGLMAGGEHERVLGVHPLRDLPLEVEVQRDRPVQQARARQAGAVAVQGVLGTAHHALVAGEAEVVVGAEHDALRALHLDDRHRRRGQDVEVGQHVGLAGGAQHLFALVAVDLGEDVGSTRLRGRRRGSGLSGAPAVPGTGESSSGGSPGGVAEASVGVGM